MDTRADGPVGGQGFWATGRPEFAGNFGGFVATNPAEPFDDPVEVESRHCRLQDEFCGMVGIASGVGHRHGAAGGPSEHHWMLDTDDVAEASDILSPHIDGPS